MRKNTNVPHHEMAIEASIVKIVMESSFSTQTPGLIKADTTYMKNISRRNISFARSQRRDRIMRWQK